MAFLLLVVTACNVQKRDITKLDKLFVQYPSESARLSNWLYPCFSGKAKSDTVVIDGKVDTLFQKGDTVSALRHDTVRTTITKTISIVKPVLTMIHDTVRDMRKIAALDDQIKDGRDSTVQYRTQLQDKNKAKNTWMWIAISAIGVITIFVIAKIILIFVKV